MVQKKKGEIIRKFSENGLLVTSHGFERIIRHSLDADKVIAAAKERRQWLISNEFLIEFVERNNRENRQEPDMSAAETADNYPKPPSAVLKVIEEGEKRNQLLLSNPRHMFQNAGCL